LFIQKWKHHAEVEADLGGIRNQTLRWLSSQMWIRLGLVQLVLVAPEELVERRTETGTWMTG
jgi:hypothetical protein